MNYKPLAVIFFVVVCMTGTFAHAATISFDPQEKTVGTVTPFLVAVLLDADTSINTVSLSILFPPGLVPVDVSDGDSVINMWIDKPHYDEQTHLLTFSGIIPGGFKGVGGRLLLLSLSARETGRMVLQTDLAHSIAYINGPDAVPDTLTARALTLSVSSQKNNIANIIPDTLPPEAFSPAIIQMPDSSGKVVWQAVFATQDKGTGVDHYEIHESSLLDTLFSIFRGGPSWQTVVSPYRLEDQGLQSTISIRAIDKDGNARTETIDAPEGASQLLVFAQYIFPVLLGILLIVSLYIVRARRTRS